jgi:hypothetical protein
MHGIHLEGLTAPPDELSVRERCALRLLHVRVNLFAIFPVASASKDRTINFIRRYKDRAGAVRTLEQPAPILKRLDNLPHDGVLFSKLHTKYVEGM